MGRHKRIDDEALLAVARAAFVERGFPASTREIARRAGVSEAVIYQRYPTKTDLFFEAMSLPRWDEEALLAPPEGGGGTREHLEAIAIRLTAYFRELVPVFLPLVTHPDFDAAAFGRRHGDSPFARLHQALAAFMRTQRELGHVAGGDAAGLTLFAALHTLAIVEHLGVREVDDDTVRAVVEAIWTGLGPVSSSA